MLEDIGYYRQKEEEAWRVNIIYHVFNLIPYIVIGGFLTLIGFLFLGA